MANKDRRLSIVAEQCSGCLRCALACSLYTSPERTFNLAQSKIRVVPGWEQGTFEITVSDDCTCCGICAMYCEFGALTTVDR